MDWELTSDDSVSGQVAETFNVTGGTVMFGDGVRIKNITLQVSKILACEQALKLNRNSHWSDAIIYMFPLSSIYVNC